MGRCYQICEEGGGCGYDFLQYYKQLNGNSGTLNLNAVSDNRHLNNTSLVWLLLLLSLLAFAAYFVVSEVRRHRCGTHSKL